MDTEKLIEAAEWCVKCSATTQREGFCLKCKFYDDCDHVWEPSKEDLVIAVREHYEHRIKSERLAVISEVREWAEIACAHQNIYWRQGFEEAITKLDLKLDEMEAQNG